MKTICFVKKGTVAVEDGAIQGVAEDSIRVRHLFSLVSAGTEVLKLQGFLGPLDNSTVGYSGVGEIVEGEQGTDFTKGEVVFTHSRHAEIVDIPKDQAIKTFIPIRKELAQEATFLQLGKVAMHGLHRVRIAIGDWIIVFGLGVVGNLTAQLANLSSAGRVIAVEPNNERRKIAEALGIRTLDPDDSEFMDAARDLTGGGASVIIETSGHPKALDLAFRVAREYAQISLVAGHYGHRQLDLKSDFQNKELSLIAARRIDIETPASAADRWTVLECAREFYKMIEGQTIKVKPLITHCVFPEKAAEIYERLASGDRNILGVIFNWTGDPKWNKEC